MVPDCEYDQFNICNIGRDSKMKIDIASISLDVKNFRHGEVKTESDAIDVLLSNEKLHRILELAQDIIEQGELDP